MNSGLVRDRFWTLLFLLLVNVLAGCATVRSPDYFRLWFYDAETGRGVPLVEIKSNHGVRYVSDSAGWIAINPRDFENSPVYFGVSSHGYTWQEDNWGFRGLSLPLASAGKRHVPLTRVNIAERLYRITGEGIYHDSAILGMKTPLSTSRLPRGGVYGQDSVVNAIYDGKLYWFWGDTDRGDRSLGNFRVSGAVSPLPPHADFPPDVGIDLNYFVGTDGFVRAMTDIEGEGVVWIGGLMSVREQDRERMLAYFVRKRDLHTLLEQGFIEWNPQRQIFEKVFAFPEDVPLRPSGHPHLVSAEGRSWFYFGVSVPNVRVESRMDAILDLNRYQAYTCLKPGTRWNDASPPLDTGPDGRLVWGWKESTEEVDYDRWLKIVNLGQAQLNDWPWLLRDSETGEVVNPHRVSVSWNEHRQRWISITVEQWGDSILGEVWYAEAESLQGPWSPATKIVTHDRYSFYNVKQHPYYADGPYLYFEGTYTNSFSGNDDETPRYDYNQIMYRLNLDDPRLARLGDRGAAPVSGMRKVTNSN